MAVIGFYDADMANYGAGMFNLELMKAATYHRGRRDVAVATESYATAAFSKLYFRKDYNDGDFPPVLYNDPKIIYGGRAFSPKQYKPLPLDIELSLPDSEIYRRYEKHFLSYEYQKGAFFRYIKTTQHARLSLNGQDIWEDYKVPLDLESTRKNIILHDYNLNEIADARLAIKELLDVKWKNPIRLGIKFPISTPDFEELLKWVDIPWMVDDFKLEYQGVLEDSQVVELIAKMKEKQNKSAQVYQNVSYAAKDEDEFFEKYAIKTYYQIIYAKNQKIRLYLEAKPGFFSSLYMKHYFPLLRYYVDVERKLSDYIGINRTWALREMESSTLFYYAQSYVKNKEIIQETNVKKMRGVFNYMKFRHYELFDKFYQVAKVDLVGEEFQDVTKR